MKIRYYGHVGLGTGYGEAAAETCLALLAAGHELEISTDATEIDPRYLSLAEHIRGAREMSTPDVVIVHTLPLDCAKMLERSGAREDFPAAQFIAYTTWEGVSRTPPSIVASLSRFDKVWVPSTITSYRMFDRVGYPPVFVVPHPFDETLWTGKTSTPIQDGVYRFLYVGAWTARKNVDGLVRAFMRTFSNEPVELVLQCARAPESACEIAQFATGLSGSAVPNIRFSNARLPRAKLLALHRECNAFVTAARGEAWNMPAFDALLARRHIIAPSGLGSDDYLSETSAHLCICHPTPAYGEVTLAQSANAPPGHMAAVYLGTPGLNARADWLEPDLNELGDIMMESYRRGITDLHVRYDPAQRFGRVAVGNLITKILEGPR